jgi:hypothetical protein
LIRYTPEDHADFQPLQNAFSKINEVVANINEGQRQAEGLMRIIDLQSQIEGIDVRYPPWETRSGSHSPDFGGAQP